MKTLNQKVIGFKYTCVECKVNVSCFCEVSKDPCNHEICPICELLHGLEPVISDRSWRGESTESVLKLQEAARLGKEMSNA